MGFVIYGHKNKNNANIEEMLFESFFFAQMDFVIYSQINKSCAFIWSFVWHLEYLLFKVLENMNLFIFQE